MRVVEISPACASDERGRPRVSKDALQKVASYERRFEALVTSGLPWINVGCYGIRDGFLVIGIEVSRPSAKPAVRASINYSGPSAAVVRRAWDVGEALTIE
jgi:hypothetical protein